MDKKKVYAFSFCMLVFLLILTSCGHDDDDTTAATEIEKVYDELAKVETALEETQEERDDLKDKLLVTSENWNKAKQELAAITQERDRLVTEISEFTNEKNTVIGQAKDVDGMIAKLNDELKKEVESNQEYQKIVNELIANIERLEQQIRELSELPVEQIEDGTLENTEISDGNNV